MRFTPQDEEFRAEVRDWLGASLTGEFAGLRGAGGPGREHQRPAERLSWHRHLAAAGWTCLGWPAGHGGRDATLAQQVIFHEEYARAGAPARVSALAGGDPYDEWQRLFLFSRADTIYGGSDEIQRNILASRILPRPRPPGAARP